jgi:hypothetical protein
MRVVYCSMGERRFRLDSGALMAASRIRRAGRLGRVSASAAVHWRKKMAETLVNFFVVNCSSGQIEGTATHQSGDGSNSTTTTLDVDLDVYKASSSQKTTSRSNHDDYWFWTPKSGPGSQTVQLNAHASQQIVLVVTDVLLVVVTSKRDKVESGKLA